MEAEADRRAPRRRTASDGSIGDQAHANRRSHHNPQGGFVDALDITHDPANGMDIHAHARAMVARQDPRLDEVISNWLIWNWERRREGWRRYRGPNGHVTHGHFVVRDGYRNDTSPWFGSVVPFPSKPVSRPAPQVQGPPPFQPTIDTEDDDMAYLRDDQSGAIFALYGQRYRHLSAAHWAAQENLARFAGKPLAVQSMNPLAIAKLVTDLGLIKDPT